MIQQAVYLAVLLLAACGGSDGGSLSAGAATSSGRRCKDGLQATIVGGDLFVAEQGAVGMTLLGNGQLSQYEFWVLYDSVFGIPTIPNRQDKFGAVQPFPPGTSLGASAQLQLPKGIPLELVLRNYDGGPPSETNTFTTASIGKDISPDGWPKASVTYGPNSTATVTFLAGFSVGLTNVCGSGLAPAAS